MREDGMVDSKRPDDEYFVKLDQKKLQELRRKLNEERERLKRQMEKELHWMKCPKCGADLQEELLRGIVVDVCTSCGGIWFDKGELDLLLGRESAFVESLMAMLRKKR